jgi:KipI family sensor histidine kinase inhibitor
MTSGLFEKPRFRLSGECAFVVEYGEGIDPAVNEKVRAITALMKEHPPKGVKATVPAYRSLAIIYDPAATGSEELKAALLEFESSIISLKVPDPEKVEIPVCYGDEFGPDLAVVSEHTGLKDSEVISIHSSLEYPIYMIGFTPGFCYLGGMDGRLRTPRRKTPRTSVPAGSVGIAESQTGMYPVESPGGWQIIGRTPFRLFAPERKNPFIYKAGDRIRFIPVTRKEFEDIAAGEKS